MIVMIMKNDEIEVLIMKIIMKNDNDNDSNDNGKWWNRK